MSLYFKNKRLTFLENHVPRLTVRDSVYSRKGHQLERTLFLLQAGVHNYKEFECLMVLIAKSS